MRGVAKFLLGGALGAVLGFLIYRKQTQPSQKVAAPVAPVVPAPMTPTAETPVAVAPEEEAWVLEAPPAASVTVALIPAEPVSAEGPEPEPIAEMPDLASAMAEIPVESEVVVTPEVLEEPVPGAGWEPSPTLAVEEEVFEEALPLVPEDVFPHLVAEPEPVVEPEPEPEAVAEEQPAPEAPEVPEVFTAAEAAEEPQVMESAAAPEAPEAIEAPETPEAPEAPEIVLPPKEPEEALLTSAGELDFGPDLAVAAQSTAEAPSPEVSAAADDLKARIEETRRRIRRELEEPFLVAEGPVAGEQVAGAQPPVIGEAMQEEPVAEGATLVEAPAMSQEAEVATGFDFDAMRSRIETTRTRLKAKAFDAMMTGESALLGRDSGETAVEPAASAMVSNEIDQTIETTLREEET